MTQPIDSIVVYIDADSEPVTYRVGRQGVIRIEAITRPGLYYCDIPYVQVWGESLPSFGGECVIAEFCQHNIVGVYFAQEVSHDAA